MSYELIIKDYGRVVLDGIKEIEFYWEGYAFFDNEDKLIIFIPKTSLIYFKPLHNEN